MKETLLAALFAVLLVGGAVYVTQIDDIKKAPAEEEERTKQESTQDSAKEEEKAKQENGQESTEREEEMNGLVECLKNEGVVIYGSSTCPACRDLVQEFGGSDVIDPVYVECTREAQICSKEMQGDYVPEIQIGGEVYRGDRSPQSLGEEVGCKI